MNVAYRIYNNGSQLVAVVFPSEGGGALVRKTWSLDSLGLKSKNDAIENINNLPYGEYSIRNEQSLTGLGGLEIKIDYVGERVIVFPKTSTGGKLNEGEYLVRYTFDGLNMESNRTTDIQKAIDVRNLSVRKKKKPISDKKYKSIK